MRLFGKMNPTATVSSIFLGVLLGYETSSKQYRQTSQVPGEAGISSGREEYGFRYQID